MPEMISDKKVFSLSEVLFSVQRTLAARYTTPFWVTAEMNKLNHYKHSGHCYPDLVDKKDGKIVAEARSVLWNSDYARINKRFLYLLKEPLKDGIKILFSAKIQFDPRYGFSLQILDIDPAFTLGDLEREKLETIARLKEEKIFDKNRALPIPMLPQRIAIISVETSKGYADFLSVLKQNPWKYKFFHYLFPSLLQGDRAAMSIIAQLNRIRKAADHFDVVAIIRGGGGEVGLSCYNHYELSKHICNFPIPVITGIGHATNQTVAETVAHTNAITPTKLAEYLIQHFHNFSSPVLEAERKIIDTGRRVLRDAQSELLSVTRLFRTMTLKSLIGRKHEIHFESQQLSSGASSLLSRKEEQLRAQQKDVTAFADTLIRTQRTSLSALEKNVEIMSPANVLKRGYSITFLNGRALRNVDDLAVGTTIRTILANGEVNSTVADIKTKQHDRSVL